MRPEPLRPKAALAMLPGVDDLVLTSAARAELETLVDLVSPAALDLNMLDDDVLGEIEILVGSWGGNVLDETLLARMPKLHLLAYAAGTVRNTVTSATWERGVLVTSAAAANAIPVAEFTFAMVIMIAKDVFRIRDRYRAARGQQPVPHVGATGEVGTRGLKIGIIGASTIGRLVIERLATLDVTVAVSDPYLDAAGAVALGVERMELDDLFGWADIISVHAPELPSTRHLVDGVRLARMHDGAWLINTARGSIVDTEALTEECVSGRLCACIDTSDPEPLPPESALYDLPNVVLTPHIAGSLGTEISRMGDLAVAEIRRLLAGEPLQYEVRAEDLERIA
jgi:phosphoglycerate dehydrogenase-like enzyme